MVAVLLIILWCHYLLTEVTAFLQVCAIKAPGFGENRKSNLQDLAILTGGEVSLLSCISLNF